jgi:glutathione peroxidase
MKKNSITSKILASGLIAALTGCFFGKTKTVEAGSVSNPPKTSFYAIKIKSLDGTEMDLSSLKGKKILIANTASECGFTPQYEELQKLQDQYKDQLVVIGAPCNQFGGQEPGDASTIKAFCQKNFGVTFPLTEKLDVKGQNQHELFQWLTQKSVNGVLDSEVKWNFCKYLINENGELLGFFPSTTSPLSSDITRFLKK